MSDPKTVVTSYPAASPPSAVGAAYANAGTAYPYSAPPPPSDGAAYPITYRPSQYPNEEAPPPDPYVPHARALLCCFLAVLFVTILFPFICYPIISLLDHSPLPAFAVSSASVSAFNISALSAPQHLLSSDFDISLSIRNANHEMGIYYESFAAAVLYGSYDIAETSLPPFNQDKGSATTVRVRIVAAAEYVEDDVAKGITADLGRGDGVVNFNVRVFAWVRFVDGERKTRRVMISVYCEDVSIGFKNGTSTVGSLVGSPKQCKVDYQIRLSTFPSFLKSSSEW